MLGCSAHRYSLIVANNCSGVSCSRFQYVGSRGVFETSSIQDARFDVSFLQLVFQKSCFPISSAKTVSCLCGRKHIRATFIIP